MPSPFRGFVTIKKIFLKIFTKTSVAKVKLTQFSIVKVVYFECFNTVQIAHACLLRIFRYGRIYLHSTYNDIYICYMHTIVP